MHLMHPTISVNGAMASSASSMFGGASSIIPIFMVSLEHVTIKVALEGISLQDSFH
jgi:hypothetical protein